MATTPGGWPYVVSADHPLEFPSVSQALANLLESSRTAPAAGVMTPASGWADYGSQYAGLYASRTGNIVTLEGMFKRTSDLPISGNTAYQIGTVPVPFRPARQAMGAGIANHVNSAGELMRIDVSTSGNIQITPSASGTIANGKWVAFSIAYRGA